MEFLHTDVFLNFHPNTLQEIRKTYNFKHSKEMSDAVDIFEEWLKKQDHFLKKDFDRKYLERTIIRSKGSVEKAKQRLDKLCTARTLMPKWFVDVNVKELPLLDIFDDLYLPTPTKDYYRVYILRNVGQQFDRQFFTNAYTRMVCGTEYLVNNDYGNGLMAVFDFREVNLVALTKGMDLVDMQNCFHLAMECYGFRVKSIHMLSNSKLIDTLVSIFKQVLSAKLGNRIYVHKTLESLHEHVDKDILPAEYGGKEKPLKELSQDFINVISSEKHRNYMKTMNAAGINEAYRQTDKFNENCLGLPGTFRTLNVD